MLGLECDRRGIKSVNSDSAIEDVTIWGSVMSGKDIVGMEGDEISYAYCQHESF